MSNLISYTSDSSQISYPDIKVIGYSNSPYDPFETNITDLSDFMEEIAVDNFDGDIVVDSISNNIIDYKTVIIFIITILIIYLVFIRSSKSKQNYKNTSRNKIPTI